MGSSIMELIPNDLCILCDQNTAVLASHCVTPFLKFLNQTFFEKNKNSLKQFQETTAGKSLCVLCAHKVVLSHKFKDIYEETCTNQTSFKKTRAACFLCESKAADLIQTDGNPNDFDTKIKSFMDCTHYPRPYLQCVTCFDCLFYLDVWFETNSNLMKKVNSEEGISKSPAEQLRSPHKIPKRSLSLTPNNKNDDMALRKGKENITPPKNNNRSSRKRALTESESVVETPPQKQRRNSASEISEVDQELNLQSTVNGNTANKSKKSQNKYAEKSGEDTSMLSKLHSFLKLTLKHLKSVKEINNSTEWPEKIEKDQKLFADIPYVLMSNDNKQRTSEESVNRICEPNSKKCTKPTLKLPENQRRSGRLQKSIEVIELSDAESEINSENDKTFAHNKYTCNICDQAFNENCDYKAHTLWHEKPEKVVVNVTRDNLPAQAKASQFNPKQSHQTGKKQKPIIDSKINKIIQKYINSPVSDTFEDTDFNNSHEIENIIENLSSLDKEDSKGNDESEKNSETDLQTQDNSKGSEKNQVEQQDSENEAVSPSTSKNEDPKIDTDKEKHSEVETDTTEGLENESKGSENSEVIVDSEGKSVPDIDSENSNQPKAAEEQKDVLTENSTDNDNVQIEQEESDAENNAVDKQIEDDEDQKIEDNEEQRIEDNEEQRIEDNEEQRIEDNEEQKIADDDQHSAESSFEKPEDKNDESAIEERLAEIHGEELIETDDNDELSDNDSNTKKQLENDEEVRPESNDDLNKNGNVDDSSKNDSNEITNDKTDNHQAIEEISDASDADESGKEKSKGDTMENDEICNKNNVKKRKKIVLRNDDKSDDSSDVEFVSPKTKRVRFAMDYQTPNCEETETVPDEIFDVEETDEGDLNSSKDSLVGIVDVSKDEESE